MRTERALNRAVGSPLVRGGLVVMAGLVTGNLLGFLRVALTAYLLGTHSRADSLAVAMGPIDALNSVVINGVIFAFVPMLTAAAGARRALFARVLRVFACVLGAIAVGVIAAAPWLMRILAPGLGAVYFVDAVANLRIFALSTFAGGAAAIYSALLYTGRRFGPMAFYQAVLNFFTIVSALALWRAVGVYAFAIGYTVGAFVQLGIVWFAARRDLADTATEEPCAVSWREIAAKPGFFVVYAAALGLNIVFTRAYATHAGPGMAAALDYCMRGVGVPLALLVSPISTSLLPEISRLRAIERMRDAFRLIDRTVLVTALAAVGGCGGAILFRHTAIAILFQRGSFTAQSTTLVAAVFLGMGPCMVGWSLMEVTARSLFALDRPWPPVVAAMVPLTLNVAITLGLHSFRPEWIGLGPSVGLIAGFAVLFALAHAGRRKWLHTASA